MFIMSYGPLSNIPLATKSTFCLRQGLYEKKNLYNFYDKSYINFHCICIFLTIQIYNVLHCIGGWLDTDVLVMYNKYKKLASLNCL